VPGFSGNGAVWIRRDIELPAGISVPVLKIGLGRITGFQTVYWNGAPVVETDPRRYPGAGAVTYFGINPGQIKPGKNRLAVRIFAPDQPASLSPNPMQFNAGPVALDGPWLAKVEYELPRLTPEALASVPRGPKPMPGMNASEIFNGVIHPIVPYSLAGILWYQGESNTGASYEYRAEFPLMITDWRKQWGQPELPFYFCQIANSLPKQSRPGSSAWAELREAQTMALSLPSTAMAVLIDLGESGDVHYRNKKEAADRLLRIALAKNYGRKAIVYASPLYDSMSIEGNAIRIRFKNVDGGLVAHPLPATYNVISELGKTAPLIPNSPASPLEGFAICGQDRKWEWAKARIDGDTVVVQSDKVPNPIAVRYAWAENPTCNLYNKAGLPASPFRTDDFPEVTANGHF
jgi:sialate O-acetylesterase